MGDTSRLAPNREDEERQACTIPMSQRVAAMLRMLCEDENDGEYIFTSDKTGSRFIDTKKAFTSACREAKIVNFTFHDLRHTWASRAAEMGVSDMSARHPGRQRHKHDRRLHSRSTEEMERAMELVASYKREESFNSEKNLGKISAKQGTAANLQFVCQFVSD